MGRGIGKNFKLADAAAAEDALQALMAQNEQNMQTSVVKTEVKQNPSSKNIKSDKAVKTEKTSPTTPVEKASENVKEKANKSISAAIVLKNYAMSNKKSTPIFKDLGERKNGQKTEYAVECSFLDKTTLGTGASRSEARENAARLMVENVGIGKKKNTASDGTVKVSVPKNAKTNRAKSATTSRTGVRSSKSAGQDTSSDKKQPVKKSVPGKKHAKSPRKQPIKTK